LTCAMRSAIANFNAGDTLPPETNVFNK